MSLQTLAYLALVNLAAFASFGWDKRCAISGERRIPERTLLGLAVIGGAFGAVAAQQAFRHKTQKEPFRSLLWLILAGETVFLVTAVSAA